MERTPNSKESPAYRELQKTGLALVLPVPALLRNIHRAVRKRARLEGEKPRVRAVARAPRPIVVEYRYSQRRLERILTRTSLCRVRRNDVAKLASRNF
jgi:hypothetical protein